MIAQRNLSAENATYERRIVSNNSIVTHLPVAIPKIPTFCSDSTSPPAPGMGANRIHNDVSPVLAQSFTDQFTVYSAKRFPGVPGEIDYPLNSVISTSHFLN